MKDSPEIIKLLGQNIFPRDIWLLIKNREIEFPLTTKEFRKFIRNVVNDSKSKTFLSLEELTTDLDSSSWIGFYQRIEKKFGEKFISSDFRKLSKKDFPLRVIGFQNINCRF